MFNPAQRLQNIRKSATRVLYDSAPPGSINLGLGEPDFATPEVVRREAIRVIQEGHISYTANAGILPLREKIAEYHCEGLSSPFTPAAVCVTTGAEEAIFAVMMTVLGPGDEALLPDPGYIAYPAIAEIAGADLRYYATPAASGFAFDRESFDRAVTDKTKLVIINSPSNPTSRVISRDDLRFIAGRLSRSSAYVLADEIYRDLYYTAERPASISTFHKRTIVLSGLSKSMSMTGWRLGWMCGEEAVIRSALILHGYVTTCASTVSQKAALAAWTPEGEKARADIRKTFHERRDCLLSLISRELGLRAVAPDGAFYTMVDTSSYGLSMEVAEKLLNHGVITIPGAAFGDQSEGFLRVSFCADNDKLAEGVRRIKGALT